MFRKKRPDSRARKIKHVERAKQPIFSYSSSRKSQDNLNAGNDGSSTESKRSKVLAKMQYLSIVLLILFGLVYVSTLSSDAQIKIDGQHSLPRDNSEYVTRISEQLNSSILNKTKLSIDKDELAENIRTSFPEVKYVEVETSLLRRRPVVTIQLAEPTARLVTPQSTYVLDEEGYALFNADSQAADFDIKKLIPINDNSGQPIEVGKPAVTAEQIVYIREIIGQMNKKDIKIDKMSLESGGLELHVKLADKPYFVKYSFLADARQSSGAYIAMRERNIPVNQYIDLRIPERAYIR